MLDIITFNLRDWSRSWFHDLFSYTEDLLLCIIDEKGDGVCLFEHLKQLIYRLSMIFMVLCEDNSL